jgi:hypothetical protein
VKTPYWMHVWDVEVCACVRLRFEKSFGAASVWYYMAFCRIHCWHRRAEDRGHLLFPAVRIRYVNSP